VPPSLIAAVLVTENTTLTPAAESSVGAQGLMQVMPMHAGARLCNSADLVDVDSNICHGTLILARNLRATSSPAAALLRYNGCVKGTNTPDCHRYPAKVLARASQVRHEILLATQVLPPAAIDSSEPPPPSKAIRPPAGAHTGRVPAGPTSCALPSSTTIAVVPSPWSAS